MEVLAVLLVLLLGAGLPAVGWFAWRRMLARADPAVRLRRGMWLAAGTGVAVGVLLIWANTGDRSLNAAGWLRYGLVVVMLAGFVAWALIASRRSR